MSGKTLALLLLLGGATACGGVAGGAQRFDGERAFADLIAQVEVGPRPAGSAGAAATRALIRERLAQAGWPLAERRFVVPGPDGQPVEMVNLRAALPGESPERIWLCAHYDTKAIPGVAFVGANDGASGVAVLLELARALGRRPRPFTVELVFFDGEEAFGPNITENDGLYGSRTLARALARDGTLGEIRALLLVDMVADRDLNLGFDRNSADWLVRILREEAERSDPGILDPRQILNLVDDHSPFREQGLREVLALIDFQFGARRTPGPLWHTAGDDLDAVSPESLNRVGTLLVQILDRVETRLRETQRAPGARGR